ncbi:hypothetical protein GWI33_010141 [Rhynchophorus ferrugineus]|uniref:Regulatory protein zeste n=1 Tax=Rhynchophorus ferrugineus TaxID=354439 RepID=A0A834MKI6_RHYFE|nr:hypothetical protein GWI33_010141 [Rhynchophorus ferrugineus]
MDKLDKHKKTARKQFEIYLQYVKRYRILKMGWAVQREYPSELSNIWQDMTIKLNDCEGPIRDTSHWKKVFTEWKSHTRRKLKYNKQLSDIETELINLTGLTGTLERKKTRVPKPRFISEFNNVKQEEKDKNALKNDVIIKEEIPDGWSDTTSASFMEEEVIDSGNGEVCPKTEQKIVSEEKRDVNKKQIAERENQSHVGMGQRGGRIRKVVIVERPQPTEKNENTDRMTDFDRKRIVITTAIAPSLGFTLPRPPILPPRREIGIQANVNNFNEGSSSNFTKLEEALNNLSNAINRYCDIAKRPVS